MNLHLSLASSSLPNQNGIFDQSQQLAAFHPTSQNGTIPTAEAAALSTFQFQSVSVKSEQFTMPFWYNAACWQPTTNWAAAANFPAPTSALPPSIGPQYAPIPASSQQQFSPQNGSNNYAYPPMPPPPSIPHQFQNLLCPLESEEKLPIAEKPATMADKNVVNGNETTIHLAAHFAANGQNGHNPRHRYGPGTNNLRIRTSAQYRVVYNEFQRRELEREFETQEFINAERKAILSEKLHLTERQIKIWFQNRRAKKRRDLKRIVEPPPHFQQHHFPPPQVQTHFTHF